MEKLLAMFGFMVKESHHAEQCISDLLVRVDNYGKGILDLAGLQRVAAIVNERIGAFAAEAATVAETVAADAATVATVAEVIAPLATPEIKAAEAVVAAVAAEVESVAEAVAAPAVAPVASA